MNKNGYQILRLGLGITFIWIAVLILRDPLLWSSFLPSSIQSILPIAPELFMQATAVLDILLGVFLIANKFTKIVAVIAVLHLLGLVFSLGFGDLSARDFGLMMMAVAIFVQASEEGKMV